MIMRDIRIYVCLYVLIKLVSTYQYCNETLPDAATQQLDDFRWRHVKPIGVFTRLVGEPLDVRDTVTMNSDVFDNKDIFRETSHMNRERIPERVVHAKGVGAFGYFEVTHDVSRYTKAHVFNHIGRRTPVAARFSTSRQGLGGADPVRDFKAISLKMYTKEGNLDFLTFHVPVFIYKDPIEFADNARAFRRNPRTRLFYDDSRWDFITMRTHAQNINLWLMSDLGIPNGYRKTNYFPEHTYEIYNKHGETFYVKFKFISEIGVFNLTNAEAAVLRVEDRDYFNRDLYNAIVAKEYPTWRLDIDILTKEDLTRVDFDPFDMTRLWKRGTYRTVTIGRLVFNRLVDNHFKDTEKIGFSPDNLVPGVSGPHDVVFKGRKIFYPDTQNYRLGVNNINTPINAPIYKKTYSRDGVPPSNNMRDAPNYFPNSFNGPMPYVDEARPKLRPIILHSNADDLQPAAEFYNEIVESDEHRQRIAENLASTLLTVSPDIEAGALRILSLISSDLGRRVSVALQALKNVPPQQKRDLITQCFADVNQVYRSHYRHDD